MREALLIPSLWRLLRPSAAWMLAALLLGALSSICEGVGITLFLPILSTVGGGSAPGALPHALELLLGTKRNNLPFIVLLVFSFVVTKNVLIYVNRLLLSWIEGKTGHALRCRMFDSLMATGYSYWERRELGKVMDTLGNESWRATQAFQLLSGALLYTATFVVFTAMLVAVSWRLTIVVMAGIAVISAILRSASAPVRRAGDEAVEVNAELGTRMWDGVAGIRTIQAFSLQGLKLNGFIRASEGVRRSFLKMDLLSAVVHPTSEVLYAALILGVLAWQLPGSGSVPATLVFLLLLFRLQPSLSQLHACLVALAGLSGSIRDVEELLAPSGKRELASGNEVFSGLKDGIYLNGLSFRYEEESTPALAGVTLRIPAGKITAIIGGSGAGKSTLAHLLCRFYDPTDGAIAADGLDLREFKLESWRAGMALASQDTHLFSTTIRENISFGRACVTDADIVAAAVRAQAHDFIAQLPKGYETSVGERGMRLSGGQRQRIALARALVRNAHILILDEATNALDGITEREIMTGLRERDRNQTVIVIAHRLSTISDADYAVVLESGCVVETGSPAELAAKGGYFASMFQREVIPEHSGARRE